MLVPKALKYMNYVMILRLFPDTFIDWCLTPEIDHSILIMRVTGPASRLSLRYALARLGSAPKHLIIYYHNSIVFSVIIFQGFFTYNMG